MIDINSKYLQVVKKILWQYVPECEVWAFGSRCKGNAKPYSDLDLAVINTKKLDIKIMYKLRDAFEESNLPIRVDVLDWHAISNEFKDIIKANHEVIIDRNKKPKENLHKQEKGNYSSKSD